MSLTNEQYDELMREYEETRRVNRILTEEKLNDIDKKLPSLKALENRIYLYRYDCTKE